MNRRAWLILAVLAAVAVLLAWWMEQGRAPSATTIPEPLVPGLAERVNDIEAIDLSGPGGVRVATLRRERERWRVMEKDGFEADFEQMREILRALAEARRVEARTARPEHHARLGLADIESDQARGLRVEFPGQALPGLIVGELDPTGQRQFVRLVGDAQTWLADRSIELPGQAIDWLERSVMDIPSDQLVEVVIRHPDGQTVELKNAGDDQWVLLKVPEGREAGAAWIRSSIADGLARLRLQDVRSHVGALPDDAVRVLFTTHDGLHFLMTLFGEEQDRWVHFAVSAEPAPEEESSEGLDPSTATDAESDEPAGQRRLVDAVAVDARLSPWEFKVREQRYRDLTRRLEDLLAEVAES